MRNMVRHKHRRLDTGAHHESLVIAGNVVRFTVLRTEINPGDAHPRLSLHPTRAPTTHIAIVTCHKDMGLNITTSLVPCQRILNLTVLCRKRACGH